MLRWEMFSLGMPLAAAALTGDVNLRRLDNCSVEARLRFGASTAFVGFFVEV